MMDYKITVFMVTCRDDYPIIGLNDLHQFTPLIESLNNQTFKDFELIIIDSLHKYRDKAPLFEARFELTHIPPKPSPWLKKGLEHSANSINTAIIHCNGTLMVKIDDCMEFERDYLQKIWQHYENGYIALSTFTYMYEFGQAYYNETLIDELTQKGRFSNEEIKILKHGWGIYEVGEAIRDTRYKQIDETTKTVNSEWYYGVSALPLKDALAVNGEDENFDGSKGLVDIDLGSRLEMNGCLPFIYDKSLLVSEHIHEGLSSRILTNFNPYWKNNFALYELNRKNRIIRANNRRLSDKELTYVKDQTDPELFDEQLFRYWVNNQRNFDLDKMRGARDD